MSSNVIATGVSQYLTEQQQQDIVDRIQEAVATGIKAGLMSAADKTKLDNLSLAPPNNNSIGAVVIGLVDVRGLTVLAEGTSVSGSNIYRAPTPTGNTNPVVLGGLTNNSQLQVTYGGSPVSMGLTGIWRTCTGYRVLTATSGSYALVLLVKISN